MEDSAPSSATPVGVDEFRALMEDAGAGAAIAPTLRVFLTNAEEQIGLLAEAVGTRNGPEIESVAHAMKSGSRTIFARELGDRLEDLEMAARSGRLPSFDPLFQKVLEESKVVTTFLTGYLSS